jgi:hypothetical protein
MERRFFYEEENKEMEESDLWGYLEDFCYVMGFLSNFLTIFIFQMISKKFKKNFLKFLKKLIKIFNNYYLRKAHKRFLKSF